MRLKEELEKLVKATHNLEITPEQREAEKNAKQALVEYPRVDQGS